MIEGELTPEGIRVSLTSTTPMGEPMDLTRLTDAEVILSDLSAGIDYQLETDKSGYYVQDIPGIPDHVYRISVCRGGELFVAETRMCETTEIVGLDFGWIRMPYDHVAVLQGQILDSREREDYYWVKVYAMFQGDRCLGCFLASSPVWDSIVFHPEDMSYSD